MGISTPNLQAQRDVVEAAQKKGGVDPGSVSMIEAHGTGTLIGDPIELKALTTTFKMATDEKQFCAIGSVKTNIGHLLSAAGVASFLKVILSLENKKIPPTLNCSTPNPRFEFSDSPFFINDHLIDWNRRKNIRRAGISSFGLGGTNAHVIVSAFDDQANDGYRQTLYPLDPIAFKRKRYWPESIDKRVQKEAELTVNGRHLDTMADARTSSDELDEFFLQEKI
jgi:acyl transferase domain-containing protein